MARINPVPEQDMLDDVKATLHYAGSGVAQLVGRELKRGIEPLELYAHVPPLLVAMSKLGMASGQLTGLDKRTRALAQLKTATVTLCEYCIDVARVSRNSGA